LKCERFDKLIHLLLDGRLKKHEESELRQHLSTCEDCAQKLALLKSMESAAKEISTEEPPKEYWDTFSSRVRERIVQREEKSFGFGLKKALQGILSFSPLKIKVAAGLISVVLVFIVGKLYVDYRGQEIVPRKESIQVQEQPRPEALKATEKREVAQAEDRDGATQPPDEPKREKKAVDSKATEKMAPAPGEPVAGEEIPPEELGALTAPKITEDRGVSVPAPAVDVQALAEHEGPSEQPSEETEATGAGMKGPAVERVTTETPSPAVRAQEERDATAKAEQKPKDKGLDEVLSGQVSFVDRDRYAPDRNMVRKMGEHDTLRQADELKRAIQIWKDYIKENPADSLTNQGYLQVATAYYLLAKLSQDTTVMSEGANLIKGYLDQAAEPELKEELSDILKKISALKEK